MRPDKDWFEEAWHYRDCVLYPKILGRNADSSIIAIPHAAFAQMGFEQIDPRWLHCGVLSFPPTAMRDAFTYVTSGLSNAWDDARPDPTSTSGLGLELCVDSASDEYWVKDVLLRLSAMQLLVGSGRLSGVRLLGHGDRIKVGSETFGDGSAMTSLIATKAADLQLSSGKFELIQLFAITDAEREFAAKHGAEALVAMLQENTTFPVNNIMRQGIV